LTGSSTVSLEQKSAAMPANNGESRAFLLKKKSGQTGAIYQVKP
jgi:hypothetical protein